MLRKTERLEYCTKSDELEDTRRGFRYPLEWLSGNRNGITPHLIPEIARLWHLKHLGQSSEHQWSPRAAIWRRSSEGNVIRLSVWTCTYLHKRMLLDWYMSVMCARTQSFFSSLYTSRNEWKIFLWYIFPLSSHSYVLPWPWKTRLWSPHILITCAKGRKVFHQFTSDLK